MTRIPTGGSPAAARLPLVGLTLCLLLSGCNGSPAGEVYIDLYGSGRVEPGVVGTLTVVGLSPGWSSDVRVDVQYLCDEPGDWCPEEGYWITVGTCSLRARGVVASCVLTGSNGGYPYGAWRLLFDTCGQGEAPFGQRGSCSGFHYSWLSWVGSP